MMSRSHLRQRRAAQALASTLLALLVTGCSWVLGIEELSLWDCDSNANCEESRGPGWTCDVEHHTCVPPPEVECSSDEQCTAANEPICDTNVGECKPCYEAGGDAACTMRDSGSAAVCVTDGAGAGACVQCLSDANCSEAAPVCDPEAKTCGACNVHTDCKRHSRVCGDDGMCVPSTEIIHVQQAGGNDSPACGALDATCASIKHALTRVDASHRYILVLDGQGYAGELDMDADMVVTIIGGNATISGGSNGEPVIEVTDGANVTLEGLTVVSTGSGSDGISCRDSRLGLKRVTVRNNNNIGVASTNCDLTIERSRISANAGGGVLATNSEFRIVNNYILDNGSVTSVFGGIHILNGQPAATQVLAFNTILNNNAEELADSRGVYCHLPGASPLRATSNIVRGGTGGTALLKRDNCDWVHSNIEEIPADLMVVEKNNIDDPCDIAPGAGDLPRIDAASTCKDAGEPGTGILVDYDGEPRPDGSGADKPDMGADEIHGAE